MNAQTKPSKMCEAMMDSFRPYLEDQLTEGERATLDAHLENCPACSDALLEEEKVLCLLNKAYSQKRISDEFDVTANRRLLDRRNGVEGEFNDEPYEEEVPGAARLPFLESMMRSFGAAPWWILSGAFHALLLLLITLIGMAILRQTDQDMVILTDLAKQEKTEEIEEKKPRDVFKKPVPIEATEISEETPIVTHEEVEISDEVETDNNSEHSETFGEDGISDVFLGGSGTVAALGLGGGGGGAFGRPNGRGGRLRRAIAGGGGRATESAVDKGLEWLARKQEADGHWDTVKFNAGKKCDVSMTGLALLAFLGAGHTEKVGKYKENVQRAVAWLKSIQHDDGKYFLDGEASYGPGYHHSIAGMAMAEAAGMSRIADTKASAQKAIDYTIEKHQVGDGSDKGGFRYSPKSRTQDISVSGWFVMQLKSAKVAGLKVDPASFDGASKFIDSCEIKGNPNEPYSGHRYCYGPKRDARPRTTAIGCLARQFMGWKKEELQGGVEWFVEKGGLPSKRKYKHIDLYYVYYGTLCVFQQGGELWKKWNDDLKKILLDNQRKDGDEDGSWDPAGAYSNTWGRVGQTALAVLSLEVYYRYLPMYRE